MRVLPLVVFSSRSAGAPAGGGALILPWKVALYGRDSSSVSHELLQVNASNQFELNSDELPATFKGRLTFTGSDPNSGLCVPVYTSTERTALLAKAAGMLHLNSTTGNVEVYNGAAFVAVGVGAYTLPYGTAFQAYNSSGVLKRVIDVVAGSPNRLALNQDRLGTDVYGSVVFDAGGNGDSLVVPVGDNTYSAAQPATSGRLSINATTGALHYVAGATVFVLNGQAAGYGDVARLRLAGAYTSTNGSTALERAGGNYYDATEFPIYPTAARKLFLRVVFSSSVGGKDVHVKLWRVGAAAYVTDLDGAGNAFLSTSSATAVAVDSQTLNVGSSSSFGASTQDVYEVHVQSTDAAAQVVLLAADLVCRTIGGP